MQNKEKRLRSSRHGFALTPSIVSFSNACGECLEYRKCNVSKTNLFFCQDSNASVDVRAGVNSEGEGVNDIVFCEEEEEVDVVSCEVSLYSSSGIQFSEVKMKSY